MKFLLMLSVLGAVSAVPPELLRPMPLPDFSPEVQLNEEQLNAVRVKALEEILNALGDSSENVENRDVSPEELINALNIIQNVVDLRDEEKKNGKSEHPPRPVIQESDLNSIEVIPPRPIKDSVSDEVNVVDAEEHVANAVTDEVLNVEAK